MQVYNRHQTDNDKPICRMNNYIDSNKLQFELKLRAHANDITNISGTQLNSTYYY